MKSVIHSREFSRKEKLLLVLSMEGGRAKPVSRVRKLALDVGITEAARWNISAIFADDDTRAIRTPSGWELTPAGRAKVAALLGTLNGPRVINAASDLHAELTSIADTDAREFVLEAVGCLEGGFLRAAVVLSWVGAVALLYAEVVRTHLAAFNAEARRRDLKWRDAKTTDDLGRMKESEFLEVLEAISVIGRNVKQQLQGALARRNACGHPNSLKMGGAQVAAHIEVLILNVFRNF